ncbi:MAG: 2-oxoglutarate ferredoxin oxidoreductase subunit alpha [Bacilli bacterium]|nr:2-oxoglutarate ferredoxin oxidoreductase subunit alpha [Bacilli bacterium]
MKHGVRQMVTDLSWKVGGEQGEGIESTGEIFSLSLFRLGYHVSTYRHFMSLIKGGHTNYKVRVTSDERSHHGDDLHILIAFDQMTIDYNFHELSDGAVLIYDAAIKNATVPEGKNVHAIAIPLTAIAKESGSPIMKNMVAIGAIAAVLRLKPADFQSYLEDKFSSKGTSIVESNMVAMQRGFDFYMENNPVHLELPPRPAKIDHNRLFISGNQATSLGAIAAGCRVNAQYPITPATEVMYGFVKYFPQLGGAVVQVEDEIAAVNFVIGASYAGSRAITATSGPGVSLMLEAIGLAGISETGIVIVDVQRSGPSTGLPTKTEQSDVNSNMYGSHGEIPRIVLTPRNVSECFYFTAEAFNLAEKYQCPVIVATDLYMGMNSQTISGLDLSRVHHERGKLVTDEYLASLEKGEFHRFADVEDGISPRALPGQKNGRHVAMGNEHDEVGLEIEDQAMRIQQMNKRARKLKNFKGIEGAAYTGPENPEVLVVGFGSTVGVIDEAVAKLKGEGVNVGHLQVARLLPFPTEEIAPLLNKARKVVVTEINSTGQLAQQIKQYVGGHDKIENCLKYDGDPFTVKEIFNRIKEVI